MRLQSSKIVERVGKSEMAKIAKKDQNSFMDVPSLPKKILISGCHLDLKMGLFQSNKYQG